MVPAGGLDGVVEHVMVAFSPAFGQVKAQRLCLGRDVRILKHVSEAEAAAGGLGH